MLTENFKIAISETLDILNHTRKEDVDKISPKFLTYLQNNVSKTYKPNLNHAKSIKEMELREETIAILAIIYRKFWCDTKHKKDFDEHIKANEVKYQAYLNDAYGLEDMFKKN